MTWYYWIIIAGFFALILCAFLIRFFQAGHKWDNEIERMSLNQHTDATASKEGK